MFQSAEGEDKYIEFGNIVTTYFFSQNFNAPYPGDKDKF